MRDNAEKTLRRAVVVFLIKNGKICLPKKKFKIGAGKRNGYGGGVGDGESWREAAAREVAEEARIKVWPHELKKIAHLFCHNTTETGAEFVYEVAVFAAESWLGEPRETKEMGKPEWFSFDMIPIKELMLDDRDWLPLTLKEVIQNRSKKIPLVKSWYGPKQHILLRPTQMIWLKRTEE